MGSSQKKKNAKKKDFQVNVKRGPQAHFPSISFRFWENAKNQAHSAENQTL